MKLEELYTVINKRKKEMPSGSYVASLISGGEDSILQKIGEEALEVILVAKSANKKRIIEEIADLFFMTLILMGEKKISLKDIFEELERRKK